MNVYIISESDEGPVKIGVASSPLQRMSELQTGNSRRLHLAWVHFCKTRAKAFALEREAHVFLGDIKIGGEWFDIGPRSAIAAVSACLPREGVR